MVMTAEDRLFERIATEFAAADQPTVAELLDSHWWPEPDRVRWDILELSKGSVEKVRHYVEAARVDYRDVLYLSEYYDTDPMLNNRDPKQLVFEVLEHWGEGREL
jgi:hypothetical protein